MPRLRLLAAPVVQCLGPCLGLCLAAVAGGARADGAFPNQLHVFVPADQPDEIVLATNFGLVESADDGKSWYYVCEAVAGGVSSFDLYQMGPTDTLLWVSTSGLFHSANLACSWGAAGGTLDAGLPIWDAAFDPNAPGQVLALANPPDAGGTLGPRASAVYPSSDDAATFGAPILVTPANLTGLELSVSSPGLVYVTGNEPPDAGMGLGIPFVLVGFDGGASWGATFDHPELAAALAAPDAGAVLEPLIRLAQVDPVDPQTAYFTLALGNPVQTWLAVTHDGGKTLAVLFRSPELITAFLRGGDATLYVGSDAGLFEAPPGDAGPVFALVHQACPDGGVPEDGSCDIQVRAISERGGLLYVSADNWPPDDMALGASSDHGVHFTRLLQFVDIAGLGCSGIIEQTCGPVWCNAGGLVELFAIDGGGCPRPPAPSGCTCGMRGGDAPLLALLALAIAARRRRACPQRAKPAFPRAARC